MAEVVINLGDHIVISRGSKNKEYRVTGCGLGHVEMRRSVMPKSKADENRFPELLTMVVTPHKNPLEFNSKK